MVTATVAAAAKTGAASATPRIQVGSGQPLGRARTAPSRLRVHPPRHAPHTHTEPGKASRRARGRRRCNWQAVCQFAGDSARDRGPGLTYTLKWPARFRFADTRQGTLRRPLPHTPEREKHFPGTLAGNGVARAQRRSSRLTAHGGGTPMNARVVSSSLLLVLGIAVTARAEESVDRYSPTSSLRLQRGCTRHRAPSPAAPWCRAAEAARTPSALGSGSSAVTISFCRRQLDGGGRKRHGPSVTRDLHFGVCGPGVSEQSESKHTGRSVQPVHVAELAWPPARRSLFMNFWARAQGPRCPCSKRPGTTSPSRRDPIRQATATPVWVDSLSVFPQYPRERHDVVGGASWK